MITVCDESQSERCPVFPQVLKKFHWSFSDPSKFEGSEEEKLKKTRHLREQIKTKVKEWFKGH